MMLIAQLSLPAKGLLSWVREEIPGGWGGAYFPDYSGKTASGSGQKVAFNLHYFLSLSVFQLQPARQGTWG